MRAMIFEGVGRPLRAAERPIPRPGPGQLLLRVHACGVCRTDLHLLDGVRRHAEEFLALAPRIPVQTRVTVYPLHAAGEALEDLRSGRFTGAAVLKP